MSLGGIIGSALGGAGAEAEKIATADLDERRKATLAQQLSQMEEEKAKRIAEFNVNLGNQQREAMASRIDTAQKGIIDQARTKNAAAFYNQGETDPAKVAYNNSLTPDDMTDEEKAQFDATPKQKSEAYVQAATQTGDLDPKTVATLTSKADLMEVRMQQLNDMNAMKAANFEERTKMLSQVAEIRAEAVKYAADARVQAAEERARNGKIDAATGRMLITSEDANIKAATTQMKMISSQLEMLGTKPSPQRAALQAQLDGLNEDIKISKQTKNAYLKQLGYPTADDMPKPAKASAPLAMPTDKSALVAGQVYQTARGPAKWNGSMFEAQ